MPSGIPAQPGQGEPSPVNRRLEPVIEAAKTIKRHRQGILQFVDSRITTGIVEGLNSKIKPAMKRANGFNSFESLRTAIYLVAGKFNIPLPTQSGK